MISKWIVQRSCRIAALAMPGLLCGCLGAGGPGSQSAPGAAIATDGLVFSPTPFGQCISALPPLVAEKPADCRKSGNVLYIGGMVLDPKASCRKRNARRAAEYKKQQIEQRDLQAQTCLSADRINTMQEDLALLGLYSGATDGVTGPQTISAMKAFDARYRPNATNAPDLNLTEAYAGFVAAQAAGLRKDQRAKTAAMEASRRRAAADRALGPPVTLRLTINEGPSIAQENSRRADGSPDIAEMTCKAPAASPVCQ